MKIRVIICKLKDLKEELKKLYTEDKENGQA